VTFHPLKVSCEAQRDAEPFAPYYLKRVSLELDRNVWVDPDTGDPIAAGIVVPASAAEARSTETKSLQQRVLDIVLRNDGLNKSAVAQKVGGKRQAVFETITQLVERGDLVIEDGMLRSRFA
jgi:hypothetical protein